MRRFRSGSSWAIVASALALSLTAPAQAEVTHATDHGFAVLHVVKINAPPEKVWGTLIAPQSFWNGSHSWSGDAANMYLDPQAGGCFCEKIPVKAADGGSLNSVEHMRVIYSERPRVLRMTGGLGPLQSEGVIGTLNIAMEADGTATKISMSYVVGGFMRMKPQDIAPAVDAVIGEQLLRLKARAEGRDPATVVWPPKKADAALDDADKDKTAPRTPTEESSAPKPVADKPKETVPPATTADPAKAAPKATPPAKPAPDGGKADGPAVVPKPPLGDRLKEADAPKDPPTEPKSKEADPAVAPKKRPIVEEVPKKKPAAVPPGSR